MSFQFNWPEFTKEFLDDVKKNLTSVLNQGERPRTIADKIEVIDLCAGKQAPDIEVLEVSGAPQDTLKVLFKIRYDGDAYLTFRTKVQANPIQLTGRKHSRAIQKRLGFLCCHKPMVVPMDVTIQSINFAGILNVGITAAEPPVLDVAFKTDPLQSVRIVSTFDEFPSARDLVQGMVEGQLRNFLTVELPTMARAMSPHLRQVTANMPVRELQRAASERDEELFRRRTIMKEEDDSVRDGELLLSSPFRQPFSPPSQNPVNNLRRR